ncbi:serpin family protein [Amycolatopsis alkalitolerans]|uniref:Serpin family protein n=1 Tax=Amycolatopsis alkalitolerans TaxID=2547244 RepID=A0A5C4M3B1_9PSEU|nr:serpin family protein [Amycolatopsis alkalitolerans]TNC27605.1 serpin family protein [Amycolatopsis alkalitolerans]
MADLDHLNFCLALHRAVAGKGDSCFSPYSIASALGLTSQATRGAASDELVALLAAGQSDIAKQAELLRAAATLGESGRGEAPVLEVANTLWTTEDLPLNQDFLGQLGAWPGGGARNASFATDPEAARRAINADVAETTHDLIPELLHPGDVTTDTVASLVNALYLKVAWVHRFREERTEDGDFHSPSGTRRVPMMRQDESFGYAARDGWQVVDLPALGGVRASVLLPDGDLAKQEPELDARRLASLLSAAKNRQVRLAMPKIKLELRAALKPALAGLGVSAMFSARADFSPLTPDQRVYVDEVIHQAVLRLDEAGLEGAAATAVVMRAVAMITPVDPVAVTVDRPFLLLVRHAETGVVYFFARVVEP